jgi:hypothetical protein
LAWRNKTIRVRELRTLRTDAWWAAPLFTAAALLALAGYAFWAAWQNGGYYVAPYHSPLYSPCLAASCAQAGLPLLGSSWTFSPAFLVLWVPVGLRATCYYYRKAYYRSFFFAPAACAVPDASVRYTGESRFPFVLQGLHRYFFYLSLPILAFLWWDTASAFVFPDGFGVGVGTLLLLANAALLSAFAASCNSCRHLCGGGLKSLHDAPIRHRLWSWITRLNMRHREYAWTSLVSVVVADLYIRLLAAGAIQDFRLL